VAEGMLCLAFGSPSFFILKKHDKSGVIFKMPFGKGYFCYDRRVAKAS
jgi:hypothetical protein